MIALALLILFPFCMVFASVSDFLTMTISNRVPVILTLAFLVLAPASGFSAELVGLHLLVGLGALVITFGFFAAGWMGGGDAKLIAATALWFGPNAALLDYALLGSVYGGALTLMLLSARSSMVPATGVACVDHLLEKDTGIPYGIALGAAGLTVYSSSSWVEAAVRALI